MKKVRTTAGGTVVPSFAVPNLQEFLDQLNSRGIQPLHPIIDIGEGKRISSIPDADGNIIRLIQVDGENG